MSAVASNIVPYITAREGEQADAHLALRVRISEDGRPRLGYTLEERDDRDLRGVLWGRCSQSIGGDRLPAGPPLWRLVHPARQRETMSLLLCQVCVTPLRRSDGILFVETADGIDLANPIRTAHPPLCLEHARAASDHCPHLRRKGHVALLATCYPLYGVVGTPYQYAADGLRALPGDDDPIPYGHPQLHWFLASQLVRELREYTVVDLDDLAEQSARAAAAPPAQRG